MQLVKKFYNRPCNLAKKKTLFRGGLRLSSGFIFSILADKCLFPQTDQSFRRKLTTHSA